MRKRMQGGRSPRRIRKVMKSTKIGEPSSEGKKHEKKKRGDEGGEEKAY